ncbi:hypothetical protein HW555_008268 [Spodoptera exigua]|uniref:Uncharacterized protein n=1 Tax=Spodoptera exigua TaxID=7107 RepID=A0A835GEM4_SPOEX|nr:hypothetical protein HW555_008268 [Spodoptera exigua]
MFELIEHSAKMYNWVDLSESNTQRKYIIASIAMNTSETVPRKPELRSNLTVGANKKDGSERKTVDNYKRKASMLDAYWRDYQDNNKKIYELSKFDHIYFKKGCFDTAQEVYLKSKEFIDKTLGQLTTTHLQTGSPRRPGGEELKPLPVSRDEQYLSADYRRSEVETTQPRPGMSSYSEQSSQRDSLPTAGRGSSKLNELVKKQNINFKAFMRTVCNIQLHTYDNQWQFENALKSLESRWGEIDKLHWEIEGEDGGDDFTYQAEFSKHEEMFICWEILQHRYGNKKLIFTSHINILLGLPNMQKQSMAMIKKMHDLTKETLHAIQNLGVDITTWDPLLVHLLAQKLDNETFTEYIESVKNPRELPDLQEFLMFLEMKFTALEASRRKQEPISQRTIHQQPHKNNNQNQRKSFYQNHQPGNKDHSRSNVTNSCHVSRSTTCILCNAEHGLWRCPDFLQMTHEQKLNKIEQLNYCKNCLYSHNKKSCQSKKRCRKCLAPHNSLLHEALEIRQLSQAGVIGVGQECIIKGKDFSLYSIRHQSNHVSISQTIYMPEFDQINHLVNIKIPDEKQMDDGNLTISMDSLGEKIKKLKESNSEIEEISPHDIHQYVICYVLLATVLCAAAVWMWKTGRCGLCRKPGQPGEGSCRHEAAVAPPKPRRRSGSRHEQELAAAPPTPKPCKSDNCSVLSAKDLNNKSETELSLYSCAKRWPSAVKRDKIKDSGHQNVAFSVEDSIV